ncbi:MAG TPA: ABC transporter permease [Gaiellales bacterium]|jgi:spermidine/putrescine transport system permease protein|nr:ABC transporter permease [Gaiellales bacterium]
MYPRWLWPGFALPGVLWLIILFVVPFYAVIGVAFGTIDPNLLSAVPIWNPYNWNVGWVNEAIQRLEPGGDLWVVFVRTCEYVGLSLGLCLLVGYPVAYYIARHASRTKNLLLILLILPFWISYLMRMFAWVNLLAPDGYVNRFLQFAHIIDQPYGWLDGQPITVIMALVYGYIPYLILPLYASLDRIDKSQLEAARDLGASPFRAFLHVTLPLSKTGILGGSVLIALPMFGDYYTPNLVSGAPTTSMLGNQIDLYFHYTSQPTIGAALTIMLSLFLVVLMAYYMITIARATKELESL